MKRPWMPLYIADYLADTAHLRAAQSGAYLHLLMHYWQHGALPAGDEHLAAIARMSDAEWRKAKPIIAAFFQPGWKHKRVDDEIAKSNEKYEKRAAAGKKGGEAKATAKQNSSNATANEQAMLYQPQPHEPSVLGGGGGASVREPDPEPAGEQPKPKSLISEEAWRIARDVLLAMGLSEHDPKAVGAPFTVQTWLTGGWPEVAILDGVKRAMASRNGDPPSTLKYFEKAIARSHADMTRQLPVANPSEVRSNGKSRNNILDAVSARLERLSGSGSGEDDFAPDRDHVQRLSVG